MQEGQNYYNIQYNIKYLLKYQSVSQHVAFVPPIQKIIQAKTNLPTNASQ